MHMGDGDGARRRRPRRRPVPAPRPSRRETPRTHHHALRAEEQLGTHPSVLAMWLLFTVLSLGPTGVALVGAAPCNVSGLWTWASFAHPNEFVVTSTSAERSLFEFSTTNPTPWRTATGVVYSNRTVAVDYACTGDGCSELGCINADCSRIQLGNGAFTRGLPPAPPNVTAPVDFAGDVAFLATLSLQYLSGSRFYGPPAPAPPPGPPRCDAPPTPPGPPGRALFSPNVQPGGYGGEFARDYTYGLIGTPWLATGPIGLSTFIWASEALFSAQLKSGVVPDVINFDSSGRGIAPGAAGNPSGQYCTWPADSPLPRPKCCDTGNCAEGSMDNVAFQVFNAVYLAKRIEARLTSTFSLATDFLIQI